MEWEDIFANDISDRRLVSKLYKELIQLNTQKTIQLKNEQKTWTFLKGRHLDDQQTHEKMFIREINANKKSTQETIGALLVGNAN